TPNWKNLDMKINLGIDNMDIKVSAFLKLTKLEFTESRTEIPGFLVLDETKLKTKWHLKKKV
ncbi:20189_t:CDS:2, partial [Rhizophagus irregularis]